MLSEFFTPLLKILPVIAAEVPLEIFPEIPAGDISARIPPEIHLVIFSGNFYQDFSGNSFKDSSPDFSTYFCSQMFLFSTDYFIDYYYRLFCEL